MLRKSQCSDEQIVGVVCESHAQGVEATAKKYKVSSHTIYRWRRKDGDMGPSQVSALKRIMQENARLKKLVAERDLKIDVMKEIASKQPMRSAEGRRTAASSGRHVRRSLRAGTT
ncbi:MAG: transposase [Candidatus Kapabacteria bacterium]|nr:transposase [Candidatus Kapabacteria bacterium]